jgi:hypothetical protein
MVLSAARPLLFELYGAIRCGDQQAGCDRVIREVSNFFCLVQPRISRERVKVWAFLTFSFLLTYAKK